MTEIEVGDVVQINPEHGYGEQEGNRAFAGCLLVVTEVKAWGVQGYVQSLGTREKRGGEAYYRVNFSEIEIVGRAVWTVE